MGSVQENKVKKDKIWLSSPTMHGEELEFVREAFETNWIAPLGPHVNAFETEMAQFLGCKAAAALDSGTAGLHLAVRLAGVKEGDIVLCQDLTFSASCNPVVYERAVPVFIDSEPETWNMSPGALEAAFEKYPQAKAVMLVHLYGTPAKVDEIRAICDAHHAVLLEDAAEALGSRYKGRYCGTFGKFGVVSFNGNKIITTSGGGMLLSDDPEAVQRARFLATQARDPAPYYQHTTYGYNYRMSNVTAGIGRGQLLHLQEHMALKKALYHQYQEAFSDIPQLSMNPVGKDGEANHWLSCLLFDAGSPVKPMQVYEALAAENIESRPIWKPMHLQPFYEKNDFVTDPAADRDGRPFDTAGDIFARGLCLPSDIKNTKEDMDRITGIIRKLFGKA